MFTNSSKLIVIWPELRSSSKVIRLGFVVSRLNAPACSALEDGIAIISFPEVSITASSETVINVVSIDTARSPTALILLTSNSTRRNLSMGVFTMEKSPPCRA